MKKYLILSMLVLFAFVSIAQEKTVNQVFATGVSYLYRSSTADTLKEVNQDTIDFWFENRNHEAVEKFVLTMSIDTLAGNDSIYYSVYGYNNSTGTGTSIATGGMLTNQSNEIIDISKWYWTNATAYVDLNYRFYRFRVTQAANNSYDGGAKFDYLIGKLYFK